MCGATAVNGNVARVHPLPGSGMVSCGERSRGGAGGASRSDVTARCEVPYLPSYRSRSSSYVIKRSYLSTPTEAWFSFHRGVSLEVGPAKFLPRNAAELGARTPVRMGAADIRQGGCNPPGNPRGVPGFSNYFVCGELSSSRFALCRTPFRGAADYEVIKRGPRFSLNVGLRCVIYKRPMRTRSFLAELSYTLLFCTCHRWNIKFGHHVCGY